jgi:LysR family cys regulon transcriptional activator
MNFQQLKFVREALRQDFNLTEVGNALYMSQSGVSKRIKELETELGIDIFVRRGKRVVGLTQEGQEAIGYIERILSETDDLKRFAARQRDIATTE